MTRAALQENMNFIKYPRQDEFVQTLMPGPGMV
jgi:hypothetical protein